MRDRYFRRLIAGSVLGLVQLGCIVPFAGTPASGQAETPQSVGVLQTLIVQTAAAAQTQTATLLSSPASTLKSTTTSTITITPTLPTATPTFFYSLYTLTPIPTETIQVEAAESSTGGSGNSQASSDVSKSEERYENAIRPTGKPWTCAVVGKSPPVGSVVKRNELFYVNWTVLNTGTKTWTNNTIDFVYHSGYQNEGRAKQDMAAIAVPPGGKTSVKVLFKAPKSEGIYSAIWSLKVGRSPFCYMKITFEVEPAN